MTQGEIEKLTVKVSNIFSELEVRIMTDIVRRIKENGFASAAVDWQISRLQQLGMVEEDIRGWIQSALQATDEEMDRIFSDEVYKQYYEQEHFFKLALMRYTNSITSRSISLNLPECSRFRLRKILCSSS